MSRKLWTITPLLKVEKQKRKPRVKPVEAAKSEPGVTHIPVRFED